MGICYITNLGGTKHTQGLYCTVSVGTLSCHQSHQVLNTFLGEARRGYMGDEGSQGRDEPSLSGLPGWGALILRSVLFMKLGSIL